MENRYTLVQVTKLKELVEILDNCNTEVGSDCKIENVKILTDIENDIYLTYTCIMHGADRSTEKVYVRIDAQGVQTTLNYEETSIENLEQMISTFETLKLT